MSTTDKTYDVAVVGLGPTGLTLAHLLGRRGISVLLLEREPAFYGNARAVYTDDEAMRWMLTPEDSLGVAPIDALRSGRKAEVRRVAQALAF